MVTLEKDGSLSPCGCCDLIVWFTPKRCLRSKLLVLSVPMSAITQIGSLTLYGCDHGPWFTRTSCLRSQLMVHSPCVSAIRFNGSLYFLVYTQHSWFTPSDWLKPAKPVRHNTALWDRDCFVCRWINGETVRQSVHPVCRRIAKLPPKILR